ncbi:MAG: A24 family peptidase [Pseudomonadales bacterium]
MSNSALENLGQQLSTDWLALALVGLAALAVGSFLNVVVYRLPAILERNARQEAERLLHINVPAKARFDLLFPRSHCPSCHGTIPPWHNIPLISWIILKGRCVLCAHPISIRYPIIEGITCLLAIGAISIWGYSIAALLYFVFLASLLTLFVIDVETTLLPDQITLPLIWLGLITSYLSTNTSDFPTPLSSLTGAIVGYTSLWTINQTFKLIRGRNGMGNGDFKFTAALGAWLGWQALPTVVLVASITGLTYALILLCLGKLSAKRAIPFGPFLSIGGCVTLVASDLFTPLFAL